jgi:Domain of unknown function (DUF5004)
MKQYLYVVALLTFVASVFSCKKEGTPSIVGTWKATRMETKSCTKSTDNRILELGANDCTVVGGIEYCLTIVYVLNLDGTFTYSNNTKIAGFPFSETKSGTYTVSDNKLTLCETNAACSDGTFTLSTSTLIVDTVDKSSGCTNIVKLTRQ